MRSIVSAIVMSPKFRRNLDLNWENEAGTELLLYNKQERSKVAEIRKFYLSGVNVSSVDSFPAYAKTMTDRYFFVPMYEALECHSRKGPTYAYHYAKTGPSAFNILLKFNERVPKLLGYASGAVRNWVDVNILRNPRRDHGSKANQLWMESCCIY